jgi:hypothetical protein
MGRGTRQDCLRTKSSATRLSNRNDEYRRRNRHDIEKNLTTFLDLYTFKYKLYKL